MSAHDNDYSERSTRAISPLFRTPSSEDESDCPAQVATPESPSKWNQYLVAYTTPKVTKQPNSLNLDVATALQPVATTPPVTAATAPNSVAIARLITVQITTTIGATKVSLFRNMDAATTPAGKLAPTVTKQAADLSSKQSLSPATVSSTTAAPQQQLAASGASYIKVRNSNNEWTVLTPKQSTGTIKTVRSSAGAPNLQPVTLVQNLNYSNVVQRIQGVVLPSTGRKPFTGTEKGTERRKTNADKSIVRYNLKLQPVEPKKEARSTSDADYKPGPHIGTSKMFEQAVASSAEPKITKPSSFSVVRKTSDASVNYRKNEGNEEQVDMIRVSENKVGARKRGSSEQKKHSRPKMIRVLEAKDGEKLRTIVDLDISKAPKVKISTTTTPSQKSISSSSTRSYSCSSRRDSKVPRDRILHNTTERKRRGEEKFQLHRLRDVLPDLENQARPSQRDILCAANKRIKVIERTNKLYFEEKGRLFEENKNLQSKLRSLESELDPSKVKQISMWILSRKSNLR